MHNPLISFRKYQRLLFLVFSMVLYNPISSFAQQKTTQSEKKNMEEDVLVLINQYRKKMGLTPLKMNSKITEVALTHSRNMASGQTAFGHDGFEGRTEQLRNEISNVYAEAENVAYGATSAKEVVNMWLHSPGHKKNIEGKYNLTGIAIVEDDSGTLFFTQLFLRKQ
ncbi:MAG: CAP domain-containing protein [Bacteroidota bacterium]